MAAVDPDDDEIQRHIVQHYAFDPERRERRHRIVGAFDNEREALELFDQLSRELGRRRESGEPVDRREHYRATVLEAGHRRRHANARLLRAAQRRGVPIDHLQDDLELPASVAILRSAGPGEGA
jgi:hypothetical protein